MAEDPDHRVRHAGTEPTADTDDGRDEGPCYGESRLHDEKRAAECDDDSCRLDLRRLFFEEKEREDDRKEWRQFIEDGRIRQEQMVHRIEVA